jgi:type VI secretion system protein ImpC
MTESIPGKLKRVRKPRVHLTYEAEREGAEILRELPFVVGVIGDFCGDPTQPLRPISERKFIQVDPDNFNDVLARMTPGLNVTVDNKLEEDGSQLAVSLKFNGIEDFEPARVAQQVPALRALLEIRNKLRDLMSQIDRSEQFESFLKQILTNKNELKSLSGRLGHEEKAGSASSEKRILHETSITTSEAGAGLLDQVVAAMEQTRPDRAQELVKMLVEHALTGTVSFDLNLNHPLDRAIAAIDQKLSAQVNVIIHDARFLQLEGTWRGLNYLVMNSKTGASLKLRVANISKSELSRDLTRAVEFDESQLFKLIYENEFGTSSGEPYGALIGDYEWTAHPEDIETLRLMSNVAAAAFAPFITGASASLFGFKDWTELSRPRQLGKIFETQEYSRWHNLRDGDDSCFVCLVMPRVMARLPYGVATKPIDEFAYEEATYDEAPYEVSYDEAGGVGPMRHDDYCWMNAAYVLGARLTDAFAQTGFCVAIRGAEGGGKVENLPYYVFTSDDGDLDAKCPTEIGITDRREFELSILGFLPICHYKNTDYAVFFGAQSIHNPKKYDRPEATANAAISARLPYLMAISRFAHYLKIIARDRLARFMEAPDVERSLNRWIQNYVDAHESAEQEMKARFPLREARVEVREIPGRPGSYNAIAYLRPWLQLEELTTSMRLVARIPSQDESGGRTGKSRRASSPRPAHVV